MCHHSRVLRSDASMYEGVLMADFFGFDLPTERVVLGYSFSSTTESKSRIVEIWSTLRSVIQQLASMARANLLGSRYFGRSRSSLSTRNPSYSACQITISLTSLFEQGGR